jgi:hypothetical protein
MNLKDVVLVKRGSGIASVEVVRIAPSGDYFLGLDVRARRFGREPDAYDHTWFRKDEVLEVLEDGAGTGD